MIQINKYFVQMYEYEQPNDPFKDCPSKANTMLGISEEDVLSKAINEPWWYIEGNGYDKSKINYPITFKALLYDEYIKHKS